MSRKTIPLDEVSEQFAEIIHGIIIEYANQLEINLDPVLRAAADELKNDLYHVTPVSDGDGGEYGHLRDNLRRRKSTRNGETRYIVDFGKKGWLSTLLEYGWYMRNGTRVPPKPFVIPTFEKYKEKYYKIVKDGVIEQVKQLD